ncbi:MAG TPA: hypothetical protein VFM18_12640 [Methanosarcina sp.]|nr:hypothetical protein [Methanosarcina sp.]
MTYRNNLEFAIKASQFSLKLSEDHRVIFKDGVLMVESSFEEVHARCNLNIKEENHEQQICD